MVEAHLAEEAQLLPDAVRLPHGNIAEAAAVHLATLGKLDRSRILEGMPHPPGANNGPIGAFIKCTLEHENPPRSTSERWKAARKRLAERVDALRDHQA